MISTSFCIRIKSGFSFFGDNDNNNDRNNCNGIQHKPAIRDQIQKGEAN